MHTLLIRLHSLCIRYLYACIRYAYVTHTLADATHTLINTVLKDRRRLLGFIHSNVVRISSIYPTYSHTQLIHSIISCSDTVPKLRRLAILKGSEYSFPAIV